MYKNKKCKSFAQLFLKVEKNAKVLLNFSYEVVKKV